MLRSLITRALRRLAGRPNAAPPLDRTGPATAYPNQTGAWARVRSAPPQPYPRTARDDCHCRVAAVRRGAVDARSGVPLLVQSAWDCLDYHRHSRCGRCTEGSFCPMVEAARARIRAWRRLRHVRGHR